MIINTSIYHKRHHKKIGEEVIVLLEVIKKEKYSDKKKLMEHSELQEHLHSKFGL